MNKSVYIADEDAMLAQGAEFARLWRAPKIVYLQGPLGAGKTTLVRGILRELGHRGPVRSPTYALIESYHFNDLNVCHVDLYRLQDPQDVFELGLLDYFTQDVIALIEWPEQAGDLLPKPDIICEIAYEGEGRKLVVK